VIDKNEFEDMTVYDSMILSHYGAKLDNKGNMLLRKLAIVMTEVKKFAYKFPGIGSLIQLPSGSNQISDMMRLYITQLWPKKYPVQFYLVWCLYFVHCITLQYSTHFFVNYN